MEIECKFTECSFGGYTCNVTKASITKSNVAIVSFKGKHQAGKSNDDVIRINFEDARVEHFPRNLPKIFPCLSNLRIYNSGLKEISREDLIGLEKLDYLNLNGNQLKSLPDDLFSNMPNLKGVFLSRNKIEFASSKLIESIVGNQVEYFYLKDNTSIHKYYSSARKSRGCKTIQELMAKIDEKCKPPAPRLIDKTAQIKPPTPKRQSDSACGNTAEREFLKGFNAHRLKGRFTDFVIAVGSKEFPVHKSILALQSLVLAEMFEVKKNGRLASKLEISNLSAEAIETFLDYVYERKLPAVQHAMEVFKLAAKYEVVKLKSICEQIIQENLDESNAFEIFKHACGPHKSEELKAAAFRKLQEKDFDDSSRDSAHTDTTNPATSQQLSRDVPEGTFYEALRDSAFTDVFTDESSNHATAQAGNADVVNKYKRQCCHCKKWFVNKWIGSHQKRCGGDGAKFECTFTDCEASYTRASNLKIHVAQCHQ